MQPVIKRKGSVTATHAQVQAAAQAIAAAELSNYAPSANRAVPDASESAVVSGRTRFSTLSGNHFNSAQHTKPSTSGKDAPKGLHTSHSTSSLLGSHSGSGTTGTYPTTPTSSSVALSNAVPPVFSGGNGGSYNSAMARARSGSHPKIHVPAGLVAGTSASQRPVTAGASSNLPPILVPEPGLAAGNNELPSPSASTATSVINSAEEAPHSNAGIASTTQPAASLQYNPDAGIKVYVRLRPLNDKEVQQAGEHPTDHIRIDQSSTMLQVAARQFSFDAVMNCDTTQEQLYDQTGASVVDSCVAGYNASILAYGQTGSGKTFTMSGPGLVLDNSNLNSITVAKLQSNATALASNAQRGLIPRVLERLFSKLHELNSTPGNRYDCSCTCSFLEIYNERIQDLLAGTRDDLGLESEDNGRESDSTNPFVAGAMNSLSSIMSSMSSSSSAGAISASNALAATEVNLRQGPNGEVHVENLTERPVDSARSALVLLQAGNMRRKVGSTLMNAHSSRSHTVLTLTVVVRENLEGGAVLSRTSRLNLVDLAGSECAKATGSGGQQLKEASNINRSLSALGNVILSIVTKQPHVPYRNSKLTYLLKEAFGGNSCLCLIANVAPSVKCTTETLSTLTFAANARRLPNRPFIAPSTIDGQLTPALQLQLRQRESEVPDIEGVLRVLDESDIAARASLAAIASQVDVAYESAVEALRSREQQAEQVARLRRQLALLSAALGVPLDAEPIRMTSDNQSDANLEGESQTTARANSNTQPFTAVATEMSSSLAEPPSLLTGCESRHSTVGKEPSPNGKSSSSNSQQTATSAAQKRTGAQNDATWLLASPGACWPGQHEKGLDDDSTDESGRLSLTSTPDDDGTGHLGGDRNPDLL